MLHPELSFRALRVRVPRLLGEFAIARADGSYHAALSRLAKYR